MKHHLTILSAALMAGAAACGGSSAYSTGPSGTPPANTVDATTSLTFTPATITVATGTTVTFAFAGTTHNVTFAAVSGAPANIGDTMNANVTRTFSTAGTYSYQCTIHSGMNGTIIVQ